MIDTIVNDYKEIWREIVNVVRWRIFNKTTVSVKWPKTIMPRLGLPDPSMLFKDPNPMANYRPWLEENIGVEDKDWSWFVDWEPVDERIVIRLHNKHKAQAPMISLMWS